jgi:hypothetical protein
MAASLARILLTGCLTGGLFPLVAQESWATRVVSYAPGSGAAFAYDDPDTALGRPETLTYNDNDGAEPTTVVVPVFVPWEFDQIVSIGEGGHLILEMGKPISNNPAHPYGVDFLVFTYTFFAGGGSYDAIGNDPRSFTLPTAGSVELYDAGKRGVVEVSEDGNTWFSFPSAQELVRTMPTLGKVWTGTAWGADTDPTIPPDPDLTVADVADMNLADLCQRYRGGAGGTGFDLADLIVPEGQTLPASFSYVKISVPDDGDANTYYRTEIDAVTVVSPVDGFTRWQQTHYAWTGDPALEQPDANGDGDRFDNWQEYARGGDPKVSDSDLPVPECAATVGGFTVDLASTATEAPWVVQSTSTPSDEGSWGTMDPQPEFIDLPAGVGEVSRRYPLPAPATFRLYRLYLEEAP